MRKAVFATSTITVILFVACKHHPDLEDLQGGGIPVAPVPWVNPDPCDPDSVYFQNSIAPLLNAYCGSADCHDAVNGEEDIDVTSYFNIMNSHDGEFVVPYDLDESELYEAITEEDMEDDDHMPPADSPQLTDDQIALLAQWILQGAPNNSCVADCDTSLIPTFSGVVNPIIQNNCIGCHGSNNPSGDVSLTSHSEVAAVATSGLLVHVLNGTNDAPLMPQGTTGLPQCMIDQIEEWVEQGAPNN